VELGWHRNRHSRRDHGYDLSTRLVGLLAISKALAMRFRLRTLMILLTMACVYLAWAAYCRRMAASYREHSSQLIPQIAKRNGYQNKDVENSMSDLFSNRQYQADQMNDPEFVREWGFDTDYATAVVNEIKARKYDRAAWYPWVLFSD
jgi:hypothetical protein